MSVPDLDRSIPELLFLSAYRGPRVRSTLPAYRPVTLPHLGFASLTITPQGETCNLKDVPVMGEQG